MQGKCSLFIDRTPAIYLSNAIPFKIELNNNLDKIYRMIHINNQNTGIKKDIKFRYAADLMFGDLSNMLPDEIIINGDTTVIKRNHDNKKIVLRKNKDDEYDLGYAFMYGFIMLNMNATKSQLSKFFEELNDI